MSYNPKLKQIIVDGFYDFFKNRFDEDMVFEENADFDFTNCYSSRIKVKGNHINGYLIINVDPAALKHSHPERKYGDEIVEEDLMDWVGEIVNRVLGNIKNDLLSFDLDTTLNPPSSQNSPFEKADDVKTEPETYVFSNGTYQLGITFQADISESVKFDKSA
ncbi:chemotaxis protein CheX [Pseudobacteriovorax antillogorgiicola]|uniref:Chemotaxis phosphatase CheX n=1 Tax=Pseudobacteriovorax antillogorgiicola TaxID=1513793 RepID=A0A1Y6CEZ6_9BACT|nr:chemotaxis protein CheX [Pseudobacteriovorax antillogorgiicola]TCS47915.1 chemotaxis phosphatase CheX-like protein [Pseudobacteriovorax antillogorgiicola]SMF57876.1 Chemotaxis phosphatase CheX [Pseudobacteriovorax antillogorgiicola]